MMRILYFYRDDTVHDRRFMDALGDQPLEVVALRLENRRAMTDPWAPPGNVRLISWQGGEKPFSWSCRPAMTRELGSLIGEIKPDVIHAGPLDLCGYLAAHTGFKSLVGMSWGYDLLVHAKKNVSSRKRIQFTLSRSAVLLVDCNTLGMEARQYGFPETRIITFPWGVDINSFKPGDGWFLRRQLAWENNIILLSTRSMEKLYGCDVIIGAFIKAAKVNDRLRLIMLGNGSQKEALQKKILNAGLESRVHFLGSVPEKEIVNYFQASDIYVSASHSDGSSISLLQAMACGIAPLVSDIPANREWVNPTRNGWLFRDGDSTALSLCMIEAASNPQLRDEFGRESCKTIKIRANWDVNRNKLLDAYRQAMHFQPAQAEKI